MNRSHLIKWAAAMALCAAPVAVAQQAGQQDPQADRQRQEARQQGQQPGQQGDRPTQPGQTQPGQMQPGQMQPGQMQPGQAQQGQGQAGQMSPEQSKEAGKKFLKMLSSANQFEIQSAEYVQEQVSTGPVADYARTVQQDHEQLGERIKQLAETMDVEDAQELNEVHTAVLEHLKSLEGDELERAYIFGNASGHLKLIFNSAWAAENIQNQELQQLVQTSLPVLQRHLQQGEQLTQQIIRQGSAQQAGGRVGGQAGERQPGQMQPGQRPGQQPGERPGQQPGERTGQQPGQQPGQPGQPGGMSGQDEPRQPGQPARPGQPQRPGQQNQDD